MSQVLHITAHMGGGVGKVLSGIASYSKKVGNKYQHKILMLEPPEKMNFVEICRNNGVDVIIAPSMQSIEQEMLISDIIQIEWWHHPKMAEFLYNFPKVPIKLIVWCHISGCNYPALPFEFVKIPHHFLFTSKYSLENPYWSQEQKDHAVLCTDVINSSGGFECVEQIEKVVHSSFNIGYIGTLSYSKLHPDFIDFCSAITIPGAKFILVGDNENQNIIQFAAMKKGILEKLDFTGYINNVHKEFSRFDIFGYPLNPEHFGTTENVLLEAMAAGLPVVALNQCAEKYLIEHMQTGLLADSIQEYAECIRYLYENPTERERLGKNARETVIKEFSVKQTVEKLNNVYNVVSKMSKQKFDFNHVFGNKPYKWFLSCLGNEKKYFEDSVDNKIMSDKNLASHIENEIKNCRLILREKSKSSIYQFEKYFSYDDNIRYWKNLVCKST